MGRRSNNGYIGINVDDFVQGGVFSGEKNYLTRETYKDEEFSIDGNLSTNLGYPSGSVFADRMLSSSVGSGSTATVGLVSGSIATLVFYAGGTGYTSAPTLSFSGGGGTGANGYVSAVAAGAITSVERLGTITGSS